MVRPLITSGRPPSTGWPAAVRSYKNGHACGYPPRVPLQPARERWRGVITRTG